MAARYRFDPHQSQFTVQAFATGLLSFAGHSPTFAVRDFAGSIVFPQDEVRDLTLELSVRTDSLALLDQVRAADRAEIEGRMRGDVLETAGFPEITFRANDLAVEPTGRGRYRIRLGGPLTLHGVTHPHQVDGELAVFEDGIGFRGESTLRMSDYRIQPVSALGGTIRLKDELRLAFDLIALPEGP